MILKLKDGDVKIELFEDVAPNHVKRIKDLIVLFVVNFFMLPFNLTISFTNLDEIIWFSTSDIKNIVSILLFNFLFIPANWNSYSKSETALRPLKIILDLYFLHKSVVSEVKEIISIFFFIKLQIRKQSFFYDLDTLIRTK